MFNFFVFAARLLLVFASIHRPCCWSVQKSLAPRTRTLLGVLGQATLNFVAVATLLFFFFCVCPKFCDLAKQRRKKKARNVLLTAHVLGMSTAPVAATYAL